MSGHHEHVCVDDYACLVSCGAVYLAGGCVGGHRPETQGLSSSPS